jgi:hypothetical protein
MIMTLFARWWIGRGLALIACLAASAGRTLRMMCLAPSLSWFSHWSPKKGSYEHASIPDGIAAIRNLGSERGWRVDTSDDPTSFNQRTLSQYDVVIWNNTGGKLLNDSQKKAFSEFIRAGGGYVGIHMAAAGSTEQDWAWYGRLMGPI